MHRFLKTLLVAVYLFTGIAPALHRHDHACESPLDFEQPYVNVVGDLHSHCSHVSPSHTKEHDQETGGHSHQHSPVLPNDCSDDCVICQAASQSSLAVSVIAIAVDRELFVPVVLHGGPLFTEADYDFAAGRGPPLVQC